MKRLVPYLSAAMFACSCTLVHAAPGKPVAALHDAELNKVVEDFRLAIINKDKEKFLALFPDGPVSWANTTGTAEQARRVAAGLHVERASFGGSHKGFIDSIVTNKKRTEEKFWNIKMNSDGAVAQVFFDYSFHEGDLKTNWGKEAWQLVKASTGWKIVSVVWSADFPPAPKRQSITLAPQALDEFVGSYRVPDGLPFKVTRDGNRLAVAVGKQQPIPLVPEAPSRFYEELYHGTIEFSRDAQGKVTGIVFSENDNEMARAPREN